MKCTKRDDADLLVNSRPYVSNRKGAEYGVVIGQRTGPDHAAFVVEGNTEPGNMASAELFATGQISETLPRYDYLDNTTGVEHIYAIFSETRWQKLEDALMTPEPPPEHPYAMRVGKPNNLHSRGVGGIRISEVGSSSVDDPLELIHEGQTYSLATQHKSYLGSNGFMIE